METTIRSCAAMDSICSNTCVWFPSLSKESVFILQYLFMPLLNGLLSVEPIEMLRIFFLFNESMGKMLFSFLITVRACSYILLFTNCDSMLFKSLYKSTLSILLKLEAPYSFLYRRIFRTRLFISLTEICLLLIAAWIFLIANGTS